jgi:hypothetical protein
MKFVNILMQCCFFLLFFFLQSTTVLPFWANFKCSFFTFLFFIIYICMSVMGLYSSTKVNYYNDICCIILFIYQCDWTIFIFISNCILSKIMANEIPRIHFVILKWTIKSLLIFSSEKKKQNSSVFKKKHKEVRQHNEITRFYEGYYENHLKQNVNDKRLLKSVDTFLWPTFEKSNIWRIQKN